MPPVEHHVHGREYWLSVEHLARSPEFVDRVSREFPGYDPAQMLNMPRRRFLKLMGASMALAGITASGCRRWPRDVLAPYAKAEPGRIPGVTERYATIMELGGVSTGLLVSSYDGRPIKVEGNPQHPYSLGASDAYAQASVLELYDPDRSRNVMQGGAEGLKAATWSEFEQFAGTHFGELRGRGGAGFAVLSESTSSPTVLDMKGRLVEAFPQCRWCEWEPIHRDASMEGSRLAFGEALRPLLHLDKAKVIVSFDADLFGSHPAKVRLARDWAEGRRSADRGQMNRLLVAESVFSTTGSVADERLAARPGRIERILLGLGHALQVEGLPPARELSADDQRHVNTAAGQLRGAGSRGLVVVGERLSPTAHAVGYGINAKLGAIGETITFVREPNGDAGVGDGAGGDAVGDPSSAEREPLPYGRGSDKALAHGFSELTSLMSRGDVGTLLILGGNPVYDAPADLGFTEALAKAGTSIHLSLYANETSQACTWHLPRAHYLESWSDGRAWDGTLSVGQPLIEPLYNGKSVAELLAWVVGDEVHDGYELVRRKARGYLPDDGFEKAWRRALHDGLVAGSEWKTVTPRRADRPLGPPPLAAQGMGHPAMPHAATGEGYDLVFVPDAGVYDGRFANNGWLQEAPDPMTKVAWDNPALVSFVDAAKLGVQTGDVIKIEAGGCSLEIAAYVMPGQPVGVVALPLGFGRTAAGHVGNNVGFNTYVLRTTVGLQTVAGASIEKTGRTYELACTQDHHAVDSAAVFAFRERIGGKGKSGAIVREATLGEFVDDPHFAHRGEHGDLTLQLFEPPAAFNDPHAWGMAIDMNSCIGCNACVIACQAENNVPIVGKEQMTNGREMHWLRIDRYFKGAPDDAPDVVHQPMMCVHCENAPCEQVCPVGATMHDTEGLNTMVYNRCIGTRYCSNNCPYKVRRFNYFDYHSQDPRGTPMPWPGMPDSQLQSSVDEIKRMVFNPDVTVRMRGVMEKCTYCTQRIAAVKINKRNQGEKIQDGDIVTACQQACPTQAIVFGDLNDPNSRVRRLQQHDRAYAVLAELNVRPRTKFLAKIRNPVGRAAKKKA